MKWRKIFDGVYEGESFKPENLYFEHPTRGIVPKFPDDKLASRVRACVVDAEERHVYHWYFRADHYFGANQTMHVDVSVNFSTHVLVLIACENPALGTEIEEPGCTRIFKAKTWTPYLFRSAPDNNQDCRSSPGTRHRSACQRWTCARFMYRFFLKLDEATLPLAS